MIAKKIERKAQRDDYRACALYIAVAGKGRPAGEKLLRKWYAGGEAEDFQEGLLEVELTQALNTRSRGPKTYHLVASFHPEDEAKLTPAVLQAIERTLAEALGLAGHQRHCGVHIDTRHLHLHIVYNLIDPLTYHRRAPYYDFPKLSQACREIETKYGLIEDRGMDKAPTEISVARQPKATLQSLEAQTGRESFFRYLQNRQPEIRAELETAQTWAEAQTIFLKRGVFLKLSGNGLAVQDRRGRPSAKASALDRAWSKARLEERYGPFEAPSPELLAAVPALEIYMAAPLSVRPDIEALYRLFQAQTAQRWAALAAIERERRGQYDSCREHWQKKRLEIRRLPMLKRDRQRIRQELIQRERANLARLRAEAQAKRQTVRAEWPSTSWNKFLSGQRPVNEIQIRPEPETSQEAETIKTPGRALNR